MNPTFRFERTRIYRQQVYAKLWCYRGDRWDICGVFSVGPEEFDELVRILSSGPVEVIRNEAAEPAPEEGGNSL